MGLSTAIEGGARVRRWLPPLLLFLALAAAGWASSRGDSRPPWLEGAAEHAHDVEEKGVGFLRGLDPAGDPRVGPAALLLIAGAPEGMIVPSARLAGILVAALSLLVVARCGSFPEAGRSAGAWFLAASPLWIEAALGAEAHLLVGLVFLVLSRGLFPLWLRVALLGWVLGWSPWAWVSVLLLPAGKRLRGVSIVLPALVGLWILNLPALLQPEAWISGMLRQAQLQGIWSSEAHFGIRQGLYPITGTLHVPGLILVALAARGWARRSRAGDLAPCICLLVLLLGLRSGYTSPAPLLILLPWAAGEVSEGWEAVAGWLRRMRAGWSVRVVPLILIVPLLAGLPGHWRLKGREGSDQALAQAWLEQHLEPGSLVVHDMGFAPPDSSRLVWIAVPFHAIDPELYRGAYWIGWYGAASAAVVSEQMVVRFLRQPERSRGMLRFYATLTESAYEDTTFGTQPGRRTRVLRLSRLPDRPLGEGWRRHVATRSGGGLPGEFLASLGAALTSAGHPGAVVLLLEEALSAGHEELGIYLNLANAQLALGRTMEAGHVLDEARRHHADCPELLYNLGIVLTRAGMWGRAARTLARLQQDWPQSPQVCYLLGLSLANDGRPEAGRRQLEKALELGPSPAQRRSAEQLLERLRSRDR